MRTLGWLALLTLAAACGTTEGPPLAAIQEQAPEAIATSFTTRLAGSDPEQQAIAITQAVYPATREENAAGAIILCPQDPNLAFTAMHRITHMPVNAPLLYLAKDGSLSAATEREMARLLPDGVVQDGNVQVYVIGTVKPEVLTKVRRVLGYEVRRFATDDAVELAELLDRWAAALKADHPDEVVISSLDHPQGIAHGLGPMGWNAHMGKGFAWVFRDRVPEATRRILERRWGDDGAFIYLTGGEDVISAAVAEELTRYGLVRRIAGPDPPTTSAVNAGYKDFGRNFGWWWGWEPRSFGWGIAQAGHNFIIAADDDPLAAIPAVLLGHMGKHGPLLLVHRDEVPERVASYLEMVRPFATGATKPIRNHAWIIGPEEKVSWEVQKHVHRLLSLPGEPGQTEARR